MTVVTSSQTSEKKYFLQISSDGHAESCSCGDYTYRQAARGGTCKHMRDFGVELSRAETFNSLFQRYDCRANGQEASQRCYYELSLGY